MSISGRYVGNIRQTDSYAFDRLPYRQKATEALNAAWSRGYRSAAQANADRSLTSRYGVVYNNGFLGNRLAVSSMTGYVERKYPRSVYMGVRAAQGSGT